MIWKDALTSSRKTLAIALLVLLSSTGLLLPSANSATPITDFDGTYTGTFTLTVTVTVPTNPPQKISNTSTVPIELVVRNGVILGWGTGFVINKAGKATITVPIAGYGNITLTAYFSRNTSTSVIALTGNLSGTFPSANTVLSGKFKANGGEPFFFELPTILNNAQIGKKYKSISLCRPPVSPGGLCGKAANKNDNPRGGRAPYNFRLEMGSSLLPAGITLNSRTGLISGTAKTGQKPGIRRLYICAFDSNNWFKGVCRWTIMTLTR